MGDAESDGDDIVHHQREASGPTKASHPGDEALSRVQNQVSEVMGVMQTNIGKVLDRGERLEDLQDKTDDLAAGALTFHKSASKLQKKMWWRNMKIRLCFLGIVLVIVAIIIFFTIHGSKGSSSSSSTGPKALP